MAATNQIWILVRQLRGLIAASLSLLLLMGASFAGDFETANQHFEQGQFAEAKQGYEQMVSQGEWTPNLFYNLGNTDFRLGATGRAILDYERALSLDPAHPEARRNLEFLRERAGSRVTPRHWYDALFPRWHGSAFALICTVSAWIAVFCFVLLLVGRTKRPSLGWLGAVAVCVALYAGAGVWRAEQRQALAIITTKEAVARLAPAEQSDIAATLPAGSQVRVLTERGDWVYCALPGEGLGWLPSGVLERVQIRT